MASKEVKVLARILHKRIPNSHFFGKYSVLSRSEISQKQTTDKITITEKISSWSLLIFYFLHAHTVYLVCHCGCQLADSIFTIIILSFMSVRTLSLLRSFLVFLLHT